MDADKGSTTDISARLKKARAAYYKPEESVGIRPIQKENETQNLQEQCDVGSTIWSRMLEGKPK